MVPVFELTIKRLARSFKTESRILDGLSVTAEDAARIMESGARQMGKQVSQLTGLERSQAKYAGILALAREFGTLPNGEERPSISAEVCAPAHRHVEGAGHE